MDELRHWLALATVHGLDGQRFERLAEHYSVQQLATAKASTLHHLGFTPRQIDILTSQSAALIESALRWRDQASNHHLIHYQHPQYPPLLKQTKQAPLLLFVKGEPAVLAQPQLAMVGSRQPTPTGRRVAHDFAAELTQQGYVITSGMARGIDSESHKGA